jgi:hypothetical protein
MELMLAPDRTGLPPRSRPSGGSASTTARSNRSTAPPRTRSAPARTPWSSAPHCTRTAMPRCRRRSWPRNRDDHSHQEHHKRHADREIGQRIGIVHHVFGGDEAGAPQHDENRRHRARQDSHYHDSFAALSAPSCAMRQGLRGEPGARSHNETTIRTTTSKERGTPWMFAPLLPPPPANRWM